jgi:hypothetical protein
MTVSFEARFVADDRSATTAAKLAGFRVQSGSVVELVRGYNRALRRYRTDAVQWERMFGSPPR